MKEEKEEFFADVIADYSEIRNRLIIDLVPKNQDLTNVPHGTMADLN